MDKDIYSYPGEFRGKYTIAKDYEETIDSPNPGLAVS